MATLVSVVTLTLTGQPITAVNVFMLLAFMNVLRLDVSYRLAYGLLAIYEAYVSLNRIDDFLSLDNLKLAASNPSNQPLEDSVDAEINSPKIRSTCSLRNDQDEFPDFSGALQLEQNPTNLRVSSLTTRLINQEEQFVLKDIEFAATAGSLTVITGPVGSGKSTLLSAIAGELSNTNGTITLQGTLVYVPQVAWVFSGTIRENLLFGKPYDEDRYNSVIEACALEEDLRQFPDSDNTIVGECGAVLSGGQRARVSLARAVYADADIYLLDDPLSAVDLNVSQQIYRKCIQGLLCNTTRVLICHEEQYMKEADQVLLLYKGRVRAKGSFVHLQEKSMLSKTLDPLYKTIVWESESPDSVGEKGRKSCFADGVTGSKVRCIPREEEDRVIGTVSSKLYWNYFRSGVHSLVILVIFLLFVITQGRSLSCCTPISRVKSNSFKNRRRRRGRVVRALDL